MPRVRPRRAKDTTDPHVDAGQHEGTQARLPLRWAVIALVTGAAAAVCFPAGGPAGAVLAAAAVAGALHMMLA